MNTDKYLKCLRKKYDIQSEKVELQAIFKKHPEIDPNNDSVDANDLDKRVLLHILIEDDMVDEIDFILNKSQIKADPNIEDLKTGMTPLCAAL